MTEHVAIVLAKCPRHGRLELVRCEPCSWWHCPECSPVTSTPHDHWLTFDNDRQIVGCHCGFRADVDSDCGWGDSVVDHLLATAWSEGHLRGLADADLQHAADNPYETE